MGIQLKLMMLALAMLITLPAAFAIPPIAMQLYGSVITNSTNASLNTNISAFDAESGQMCGSFIVKNKGYFGLLACEGDDPDTGKNEGPKNSIRISFKVNNTHARAHFTTTFEQGQLVLVNITSPNHEPILSPIGFQQARAGAAFALDVEASDDDNDTLNFSINTTLIGQNNLTGFINFTPTSAQIGNYSINFSTSDNLLSDYEIVLLEILPPPVCGDEVCSGGEACTSCPQDCGECEDDEGSDSGSAPSEGGTGGAGAGGTGSASQNQGSTGASGGGGGGDGGGEGGKLQAFGRPVGVGYASQGRPKQGTCTERWVCSEWSLCSQEEQMRECKDINSCGTAKARPLEKRACEVTKEEPCSNKKKDIGETDVDCGGSCQPCTEKKFAQTPSIPSISTIISAQKQIARQLPWIFMFIVMMVSLLTLTEDRIYVRKISKKKMEEYAKNLRMYKAFRRKLHKFLISFVLISAVISAYLYYFSDNPELILQRIYLPIIGIIAIPAAVSYVLRQAEFSNYNKAKIKAELELTHEMQVRKLIRIENSSLLEIERQTVSMMQQYLKGSPQKMTEITEPMMKQVQRIRESHESKSVDLQFATIGKADELSSDPAFAAMGKSYVEFVFLQKSLAKLKSAKEFEQQILAYGELVFCTEKIATDKVLMEILSENKEAALAYNRLVDIYSVCHMALKGVQREDEAEVALERELVASIQKFVISKPVLVAVEKDNAVVRIHNNLVDLYGHYKKKQDLYEAIRAEQNQK